MKPTITIKAKNELIVTAKGRVERTQCGDPMCKHFLCETPPLDGNKPFHNRFDAKCPGCGKMNMVEVVWPGSRYAVFNAFSPRVY